MGVSIVTYTVGQENAEELRRRVQEHIVPAAREVEGYCGFLFVDQGDGKRLALLLFDSVDAARAAQGVLTPVGSERTHALMTSPAIGSLGTVILSDGVFAESANP